MYLHPLEQGWWSCKIADFEASEWQLDDETFKTLGTVTWGPSSVIEVETEVYDRNGTWSIRSVIRKPGDVWEQTATGRIVKDGVLVPLVVHQSADGKREYRDSIKPSEGRFSKAELVALGVPIHESSGSELTEACKPYGYTYEQRVDNKKSVTVHPNFGK
jgi:hypothetical protein